MATVTGTPGTLANVGTGDTWSVTPATLLQLDDNAVTQSWVTHGAATRYLYCTGLGLDVPVGATIEGITVTLTGFFAPNGVTQKMRDSIQLVYDGSRVGDIKASGVPSYLSDDVNAVYTYGAADDAWDRAWTRDEIVHATFGVSVLIQNQHASNDAYARLDQLQVVVTYAVSSTSETRYPTVCSTGYLGDVAWSGVDFAEGAPDLAVATAQVDEGLASQWLRGTVYGFTIPAGATILGVKAGITCSSGTGQSTFTTPNGLRLYTAAGYTSGATKSPDDSWTNPATLLEYGGEADLWGLALTSTIVNSAVFGIGLQGRPAAVGQEEFSVDSLAITVWWEGAEEVITASYGGAPRHRTRRGFAGRGYER